MSGEPPDDFVPEDGPEGPSQDVLPEELPPLTAVPDPARRSTRAKALIAVLVLIALAAAGFGVLQTKAFAVSDIEVGGNAQVGTDQILNLAGIKSGRPMVSVDTGRAEKRIKSDPWIATISVKRKWPHTVQVSVVERTAAANVQTNDGRWARISDGGTVLQVDPGTTAGLPVLVGEKVDGVVGARVSANAMRLVTLVGQLPDSLRPKVVQLQKTEANEFRLGLSTGPIVELGDETNLGDKLMAAAAVLAKEDNKNIEVLDVRSPRLPVALPKVASTSTTAEPTRATTTTTAKATARSTTTTTTAR